MAVNRKSVLIIAGGTGGHISPGVALYEEFKKSGVSVIFLSGKRDARFPSLKDVSNGDMRYYRAPSLTRNILKLPFFLLFFILAVLKARKIIKQNNVGAAIGMGGYVSAPALFAAKGLKIPIFLCEQNSVPGRVTRMFEKNALRLYGTFTVSREHLKFPEKFVHAGNPIRKRVLKSCSKQEAKRVFHLGHNNKVILAIGGSQGALKINELIFGLKKSYSDEFKNVGIIWSTGSLSYNTYREKVQSEMDEGSIYLSPFIERVGMAYQASDLAICRSGAGVMMELAALGIPSILVPYPHAAMDHQTKNADEFVKVGASIKVNNDEAVPEKVIPLLLELLHNDRALKRMADKTKAVSKGDAAADIVADLLNQGVL